jgi:arylsulfatase
LLGLEIPSATAGRTEFTYRGANPGIPAENAPNIMNKDYKITAEITVPASAAEGMIATFGGRFSGYGLYLLKGRPVFVYNMLDLKRYRWEGGVGARGFLMAIDESFGIGVDTRTGVDDSYRLPSSPGRSTS